MPRGGYQKPNKPASVSGPGRFSRRTDGKITAPDIDKERGLQYGDRKASVDAQRIAKTAVGAGASVPTQRAPQGSAPTRGRLPSWLFSTPDNHPEEPTTAGLDMGPGGGSEMLDAQGPTDDLRVMMLRYLDQMYGNQDAREMLAEMRAQKAAPTQPAAPVDPGVASPDEGALADPLADFV